MIQVLYCLYSLKPNLFVQSRGKMNLERGEMGWGLEKDTYVACLKLDKAPPVNLLEV